MKKHVSDVLKPENVLKIKENKIAIISGVGSGKNYFIENVLSELGYVLCVTSRRAKANEILLRDICEEHISWDTCKEKIIATTNYGIELFARSEKFSANRKKVIEHFDYIVIDEAHSICADATFTTAAFHVNAMLNFVSEHYPEKKIILMTGTPEPILNLLKEYKIFDLRDECINVMPAEIKLISKRDVFDIIKNLPEEEKTIYMGNSARGLISGKFFERICEVISADEMSFCMSEGAAVKYKAILPRLEENVAATKKQLRDYNCLSDQAKILLTTTTLREGINLEDEKVKVAFCESVVLSDIQQFAGRVRKGLDTLYIVYDARQHDIPDEKIREAYMLLLLYRSGEGKVLENINTFFREHILKEKSALYVVSDNERPDEFVNEYLQMVLAGESSIYAFGGKTVRSYIEMIMRRFEYIIFNYFKDTFEINIFKFAEEKRINSILKNQAWEKILERFCEENSIHFESLNSMHRVVTEELQTLLDSTAGKTLFLGEKSQFLGQVSQLLGVSDTSKVKTLNSGLQKLGMEAYNIEIVKTKRNGKDVRGIRVTKNN